MNYEKMTTEKFAANLAAGKYATLTGARRAIGKVKDWKKPQREAARALAEKHFASQGSAEPAKTTVSKKTAKKPAPKETAPSRPISGSKGSAPAPMPTPRDGAFVLNMTAEQIAANPHQAVAIADRTINAVSSAIATARAMRSDNKDLDISEIEEAGMSALNKSVLLLDHTIDPVASASPRPATMQDAFSNGVPPAATPAPEAPSAPPSPAPESQAAQDVTLDPAAQAVFDRCADASIRVQQGIDQTRSPAITQ